MCPDSLLLFWPAWWSLWLAGAATATAARSKLATKPCSAKPTSSPPPPPCVQTSPHKPLPKLAPSSAKIVPLRASGR